MMAPGDAVAGASTGKSRPEERNCAYTVLLDDYQAVNEHPFWSDAAAFDWPRLPDRFAVKPDLDSGMVALVGAGSARDVSAITAQVAARLAVVCVLEGTMGSPARRGSWLSADGSPIPVRMPLRDGKHEPDLAVFRDVVAIAETLAAGFTHLRVDLMVTNADLLVKELRAYNLAGSAGCQPRPCYERLCRRWTRAAAGERAVLEPRAEAA